MDKAPDPIMNRGVVAGFAQRKVESGQVRKAQLDKPMDDLFKPEKKMMDDGPKGPKDMGDMGGMDDILDEGLGDKPDMHLSFEELLSAIENFDGAPDELEELCDACQDKLMGMQTDDLDTEMDRDEAGMKDDMKKYKPLGGDAMEGAMPPKPPASAAPSPMR